LKKKRVKSISGVREDINWAKRERDGFVKCFRWNGVLYRNEA